MSTPRQSTLKELSSAKLTLNLDSSQQDKKKESQTIAYQTMDKDLNNLVKQKQQLKQVLKGNETKDHAGIGALDNNFFKMTDNLDKEISVTQARINLVQAQIASAAEAEQNARGSQSDRSAQGAGKVVLKSKINIGAIIGTKIVGHLLKKSLQAERDDLKKEKMQMLSIQVDLGVSLMTGQTTRDPIQMSKDPEILRKMVNVLKLETKELKTFKNIGELLEIVKKMPFWSTLPNPFSEDDYLGIIRCFKYEYFPAGSVIRRAGTECQKLYYILEGKVGCAMPKKNKDGTHIGAAAAALSSSRSHRHHKHTHGSTFITEQNQNQEGDLNLKDAVMRMQSERSQRKASARTRTRKESNLNEKECQNPQLSKLKEYARDVNRLLDGLLDDREIQNVKAKVAQPNVFLKNIDEMSVPTAQAFSEMLHNTQQTVWRKGARVSKLIQEGGDLRELSQDDGASVNNIVVDVKMQHSSSSDSDEKVEQNSSAGKKANQIEIQSSCEDTSSVDELPAKPLLPKKIKKTTSAQVPMLQTKNLMAGLTIKDEQADNKNLKSSGSNKNMKTSMQSSQLNLSSQRSKESNHGTGRSRRSNVSKSKTFIHKNRQVTNILGESVDSDQSPEIVDIKRRKEQMKIHESDSDISDSEIPINYYMGQPKEVIFADLGRGQYFGVLSLQTKRAFTEDAKKNHFGNKTFKCFTSIYALQNTHCFSLDNDAFVQHQNNQQNYLTQQKRLFLRRIPQTAVLNPKQITTMAQKFTYQRIDRGTVLFEQGQRCTHMYIVMDGQFQESIVQYEEKPKFTEQELDRIFDAPLQANKHNSVHNVKNTDQMKKTTTICFKGNHSLLGLIETIQRKADDVYTSTITCSSPEAILLTIKAEDFRKASTNQTVWEKLMDISLEEIEKVKKEITKQRQIKLKMERMMVNANAPDPTKSLPIEERMKFMKRGRRSSTNATTRDDTNFSTMRDVFSGDTNRSTKLQIFRRDDGRIKDNTAFFTETKSLKENSIESVREDAHEEVSRSPKKYTSQINYKQPRPYDDQSLQRVTRVRMRKESIQEKFLNPYDTEAFATPGPTEEPPAIMGQTSTMSRAIFSSKQLFSVTQTRVRSAVIGRRLGARSAAKASEANYFASEQKLGEGPVEASTRNDTMKAPTEMRRNLLSAVNANMRAEYNQTAGPLSHSGPSSNFLMNDLMRQTKLGQMRTFANRQQSGVFRPRNTEFDAASTAALSLQNTSMGNKFSRSRVQSVTKPRPKNMRIVASQFGRRVIV